MCVCAYDSLIYSAQLYTYTHTLSVWPDCWPNGLHSPFLRYRAAYFSTCLLFLLVFSRNHPLVFRPSPHTANSNWFYSVLKTFNQFSPVFLTSIYPRLSSTSNGSKNETFSKIHQFPSAVWNFIAWKCWDFWYWFLSFPFLSIFRVFFSTIVKYYAFLMHSLIWSWNRESYWGNSFPNPFEFWSLARLIVINEAAYSSLAFLFISCLMHENGQMSILYRR